VLVKVLSASADSGSDWKPWFAAAAAMANGGDLSARGGGVVRPQPGTHLLYRCGGLPLRPRLTEAGAGSKTSADALGRGRARMDRWVL
jgi:hypothetical protein